MMCGSALMLADAVSGSVTAELSPGRVTLSEVVPPVPRDGGCQSPSAPVVGGTCADSQKKTGGEMKVSMHGNEKGGGKREDSNGLVGEGARGASAAARDGAR